MVVLFVTIAASVFAILIYGVHRYLLDKWYDLPPGPAPYPFVGNLLSLRAKGGKSWLLMRDFAQKYGSVFTLYLGQYRLVVLSTPEVINDALIVQAKRFSHRPNGYLPSSRFIKPSLLFGSGEEWRMRRRLAMKTMRDLGMGKLSIIEKLHDEIVHLTGELSLITGKPWAPRKLIANAVSNIICDITFGKRFEYNDPQFVHLLEGVDSLVQKPLLISRLLTSAPIFRFLYKPEIVNVGLKVEGIVGDLFSKAVAEHRKDFDCASIRNFADLFIQTEFDGVGLSLDEFNKIIMDLFIAGTETTATALCWTLLLLSQYPEIQQKCQEEIDLAIKSNRLPSLEDRLKLVYIDSVMNEVFRFVTILPGALMHANLEFGVINGYDIPSQTMIFYNVWALHHNVTYWKDPEVFRPERWIDTDGKLLSHSGHFMPFGLGPRICLGESLARVEFFVFLVAILHRFSFKMEDGVSVNLEDSFAGSVHSPPPFKLIASHR